MNVKELNIDSIEPEPKDYDRAVGLASSYDEYIPDTGKAQRMANAIKDPYKLVRRAKAIVGAWGTDSYEGGRVWIPSPNVWIPFDAALRRMGFTESQIDEIARFEIDESLLD
jgi:hypothetical protein